MQKMKDEFVAELNRYLPLAGLSVLDVGCGNGERSALLAGLCDTLTGTDRDAKAIDEATKRGIPNAAFSVGLAGRLEFTDESFDVVIFAKSLHHVPPNRMNTAISEAVRVVRPAGHIVFLELADTGSFGEASRLFVAKGEKCEGAAAIAAIHAHSSLHVVEERANEALYKFDSVEDFVEFKEPTANLDQIEAFLTKHNWILNDIRRIIVTQPNR